MAEHYPDFSEWNNSIACLFENLQNPDFPTIMLQAICSQVHFDQGMSLAAKDMAPVLLSHIGVSSEQEKLHIDPYLSGAYLLDPMYEALKNGIPSGFYRLQDLAPDDFYQSEYYQKYYKPLNIIEDVYFFAILPDLRVISFSLGRYQGNNRLSSSELDRLRAIEPVVVQAGLQYLRWMGEIAELQAIMSPDMSRQLESAFNSFGSSVLTERESELVRLLLRGHSNQSAADKMAISIDTVKMHRKNINSKLDITSQAELFSLFISSLACVQKGSDQDPLVTLLSVPQRSTDD